MRCNSTLNAEELEQEKVEERFKERKEVIDSRSKEIDRLLTLKGRLASAGEIAQKARSGTAILCCFLGLSQAGSFLTGCRNPLI